MKQLVAGVAGLAAVVAAVLALSGSAEGSGRQDPTETTRAQTTQPRAVCETRRVGQDVEVVVRLRLTDDELDVSRDRALVVADLGDVTQTRTLRRETRDGGGYAVTFENLPADATPRSFSLRASPSPDDPASFTCDSSAAGPAAPPRRGSLPRSGA